MPGVVRTGQSFFDFHLRKMTPEREKKVFSGRIYTIIIGSIESWRCSTCFMHISNLPQRAFLSGPDEKNVLSGEVLFCTVEPIQ